MSLSDEKIEVKLQSAIASNKETPRYMKPLKKEKEEKKDYESLLKVDKKYK